MSPRTFEDGTTGRPLGDDEDLGDGVMYGEGPDPGDPWLEMSPAERARATAVSG